MFICQVTGKNSKSGEKPIKLVVATRQRVYTQHVRNEETREWELLEVGKGWEIVKELNASQEGVLYFQSLSDDQKQLWLQSH